MNITEDFVVKHYAAEDFPEIKGNGMDGIKIGEDRTEDEGDFEMVTKYKLPEGRALILRCCKSDFTSHTNARVFHLWPMAIARIKGEDKNEN